MRSYGAVPDSVSVDQPAAGLSIERIGILAAVYPAVWGAGQLITGPLSDRIGRKPLIAGGMLVLALALVAVGQDFGTWLAAVILLGAGTAMVYPTLLAAIGDVAHPEWRARSVGIYRLWRDGGFAVGALVSGLIADAYGIPAAVSAVAAVTAASGVLVTLRMRSRDHAPMLRIKARNHKVPSAFAPPPTGELYVAHMPNGLGGL